MTDQCGLFDLPEPVGVPHARSPGRGRARETFLRRVVADVTVQDAGALRAQALRLLEGGAVALRFVGHWAAEPGAPLRGVPGITWAAMEVDVEQVFARAR